MSELIASHGGPHDAMLAIGVAVVALSLAIAACLIYRKKK